MPVHKVSIAGEVATLLAWVLPEFTNIHPALPNLLAPGQRCIESPMPGQPVGVRLAGQGWVLARIDGAVSAFPDACPHRRARLSAGQIVDGTLQCRYHGWRYAADGTCTLIPALDEDASIPARATLERPAAVAEQGGLIWLSPRTPRAPLPVLPQLPAGDDIATVVMPAMRVPSNAALLVDNFLDEAHFPFVHAATIGGAGPEPIARPDIERDGLAFTAIREHTFTNLNDPDVKAGTVPAVQRRRMTYGYQAPLHATLLLEFLDTGTWQFLTFTAQPEDAGSCRIYQTLTQPGLTLDPVAMKDAVDYEMSIFAEDLDLQQHALTGLEFPLDPAAELHIRADRISVEFRRVLAEAMKALRPDNPGALDDQRHVHRRIGEHADVLHRVGIQHDQVRHGAGLERAQLTGGTEQPRGSKRRRADHLQRRLHPAPDTELLVLVPVHAAEQVGAVDQAGHQRGRRAQARTGPRAARRPPCASLPRSSPNSLPSASAPSTSPASVPGTRRT